MRRELLLVLLATAACDPASPPPPAPGAVTTLATFTGEVDTTAGTFTVRTDPPTGGTNRTGLVTIPTDGVAATIGNSGNSWNRTPRGASICGNQEVTGANVVVTAKYASPTFLGGVYAQIDTIASGTGVRACTGNLDATAPSGLSNTWGLWSYGTLDANGSATVEWDFVTGTAASFTFRGSLKGVVGDLFTYGVAPKPPTMAYVNNQLNRTVAYNPTTQGLVYVTDAGAIAFVKLDGTYDKSYTPAAGAIQTLAVHPTAARIWYTRSNAGSLYIGLLQGDGTLLKELAYGGNGLVTNVAPDPNDATGNTAAFVDTGSPNPRILTIRYDPEPPGTLSLGAATPTNVPTPVLDLAFGGDGKLYVTGGTNILRSCTGMATPPGDCSTTFAVAGGTPWTVIPLASPDAVAYSVRNSAIYEVDGSGTQTQVGSGNVANARQVADGSIWFNPYVGTQSFVSVGYPSPYSAELLGSSGSAQQLAVSPAVTVGGTSHPEYLWVGGDAGLYRIKIN